MYFIFIIIVIIAIVVCFSYSNTATQAIIEKRKLEREVRALKAEIAELKNNQEHVEEVHQEKVSNVVQEASAVTTSEQSEETRIRHEEEVRIQKERVKYEEEIRKEEEKKKRETERRKKEVNELERRNTTIMATGAILVILAAIVFLSSTWSILSNGIKTIGLVLFLGIFAGASKISKEQFHLEKASKTFFYLAMAYIPICFISLSVFELLGEYLSIYGDGVFIYFFASSAITAAVYYYFYITRNDITLFYGSLLTQAACMVLFVLIFSTDIRLIVSILLAYNLALAILCSPKTYKLLEGIVNIASYIALIVSVFLLLETSWINVLVLVLLALNFLLLNIKFKEKTISAFIFNIVLYVTGFYLAFSVLENLSETMQLFIALVYCVLISVLESTIINGNPRYDEFKKSLTVVSLISIALLYIEAIYINSEYIKPYMIALVGEAYLINILVKTQSNGIRNFVNYAIPVVLLFIMVEIGYYFPIIDFTIVTLILCLIGELFKNSKYSDLNTSFSVIGGIVWTITFITLLVNPVYKFISKVVLLLIALYYLFSTKKSVYKYLSYLAFGLLAFRDIKIDLIKNWMYVVPTLLTAIVAMFEIAQTNLRDDYSCIFITIMAVISYAFIGMIGAEVSVVIAFLFSALLYFYYITSNEEKIFRIVPMFGLLLIIRLLSAELEMLVLWEIIYTVLLVLITVCTGKISYESIGSGVMLILFLGPDLNSAIISSALCIAWSVIHLIMSNENEKMKDVFTGLTIISCTYFYYALLSEIGILDEYISLLFVGIALATIGFMEKILKKYISSETFKILEYVIYGLICLCALSRYRSEIDGMIFVLFLIVFAGLSFRGSKSGKFKVAIIAILVNAFLLTREFWFSLPWWIYLLFAGIGLIGFAMINESNSNKKGGE